MHGEVQAALREVTAPRLGELAKELDRTISFVRTRYPSIVPQRLCLFGEGATVRNVAAHVAERIGLPVDVWRMPSSAKATSRVPDKLAPLLGAAVALSALAWSQ
jgi:Tfp pilus assembly PilM family ATPase